MTASTRRRGEADVVIVLFLIITMCVVVLLGVVVRKHSGEIRALHERSALGSSRTDTTQALAAICALRFRTASIDAYGSLADGALRDPRYIKFKRLDSVAVIDKNPECGRFIVGAAERVP